MKDETQIRKELGEKYPNEKMLSCLTCKNSVATNESDLRCGLTNTFTTENHICENYIK